jgi:hypothetical protein
VAGHNGAEYMGKKLSPVECREFVAWMSRLGKEDRDLYRSLRAEAWTMVAANHREQTPAERRAWLRKSS